MEAEHGDIRVPAADGPPAVRGANRVRRVLDDAEPIAIRQRADRRHVARQPGEMHGNDDRWQRACLLGLLQLERERRDRHVARCRIDIDEIHACAAVQCAVCRGDEAVGTGPDPRARPCAEREAGDVKSGGGVRDGDRMRDIVQARECRLEARNRRPLRQPAGGEHLPDGFDIGFAYRRRGVMDVVHSDRWQHDRVRSCQSCRGWLRSSASVRQSRSSADSCRWHTRSPRAPWRHP